MSFIHTGSESEAHERGRIVNIALLRWVVADIRESDDDFTIEFTGGEGERAEIGVSELIRTGLSAPGAARVAHAREHLQPAHEIRRSVYDGALRALSHAGR